ncbi:MAG: porin family protein [Prolixibacteraceae bacterium]
MRRKIVILFTGFLLLVSGVMNPLFAQLTKDENLSRFDDRLLHFGFYLGVNTMSYRFTHYSDVMQNPVLINDPVLSTKAEQYYNGVHSYRAVISDIKPGFSVGGVVNLRMNTVIDFRFTPGMSLGSRQLVFSENIVQSMQTKASQSLYSSLAFDRYMTTPSAYIDFPVGFRYKGSRFGNVRPYIYGGGAFKWDLENKRVSESVVHLKRSGYYAEVAFGLDSYFPFFRFTSEFKFSYGLNNIIRHDADYVNSTDPLPYFGYIFEKLNSNVFTLLVYFE